MIKAQHTKGPWTCSPSHKNDYDYEVFTADRNILTYDLAQAEANARLIAAAPDEDAANRNTVEKLEYYIGNPSAWKHYDDALSEVIREVVDKARAAIAKAKGE